MKKSLLALLLALSSLTLTSCWDNDSGLDENYIAVYDGIVLYVGATNANTVALDAVSIAMRLGVLLNEVEAYNAENPEKMIEIPTSANGLVPYWSYMGKFTYGGYSRYPSKILLGDFSTEGEAMDDDNPDGEVKIWRDESDNNIYYIQYGVTDSGDDLHTQAWLDNIYRRGTFVINTNGVMLDKSDASKMWTVSALEGEMLYSSGNNGIDVTDYVNQNVNAMIYHGVIDEDDQTEGFIYSITAASPCIYDSSTTVDGNWDMSGYIEIVDFDYATDTFDLENTEEKRFELTVDAEGQPISVPEMTFKTKSPMEFRPMDCGFSIYNTRIEIKLTSSSSDYADDDVYVEIDNDGYWIIEYNGTTYYDSED